MLTLGVLTNKNGSHLYSSTTRYCLLTKKKDQILLNNELHYFSCASSYYFVADESHLLMESIGW